MIPLLVPLFISAFRRANDLAMAMEARCYRGGDGRTKMKPLHYTGVDRTAYVLVIFYVAAVVIIGRCVPFHVWISKLTWERTDNMKRIKLTVAYDGTAYCGCRFSPMELPSKKY